MAGCDVPGLRSARRGSLRAGGGGGGGREPLLALLALARGARRSPLEAILVHSYRLRLPPSAFPLASSCLSIEPLLHSLSTCLTGTGCSKDADDMLDPDD